MIEKMEVAGMVTDTQDTLKCPNVSLMHAHQGLIMQNV